MKYEEMNPVVKIICPQKMDQRKLNSQESSLFPMCDKRISHAMKAVTLGHEEAGKLGEQHIIEAEKITTYDILRQFSRITLQYADTQYVTAIISRCSRWLQ